MRRTLVVLAFVCGLAAATSAHAQSERSRGLWEGTFHGGRGDQAMGLVVRPRGATGFAGVLYQDGYEMGPVESGRVSGDSLTFSVMGLDFVALAAGHDRLALSLTPRHGQTHHFEMSRSSLDTTRTPQLRVTPGKRPQRQMAPDSMYRAHAVPRGAAVSMDASLRKGTLLLVGGGPSQADLSRRFVELAGGANARIVVIPTASIETADSGEAARLATAFQRNLGVSHVAALHTTSRREADSEAFVAPLQRATGVWILGGEASWLLDSYLGTRTERELIAVLQRGGVVGGTSAGAVFWASSLMTFRRDTTIRELQPMRIENLVIGDPRGTGVGLLRNVTIAPHFSSFHLETALQRMVDEIPGLLGIGIDEATALEVHGDVGRVLGRGNVTIFPAGPAHAPVVLAQGARYDLIRGVTL